MQQQWLGRLSIFLVAQWTTMCAAVRCSGSSSPVTQSARCMMTSGACLRRSSSVTSSFSWVWRKSPLWLMLLSWLPGQPGFATRSARPEKLKQQPRLKPVWNGGPAAQRRHQPCFRCGCQMLCLRHLNLCSRTSTQIELTPQKESRPDE
uniref:Putative secreted protein n=1 Tax=Amblyomma cajennense TaxID=34607 RepID=A0A023FE52_AMBCJ